MATGYCQVCLRNTPLQALTSAERTRWYLLAESVTRERQDERNPSRLMTANSRANNQMSAKLSSLFFKELYTFPSINACLAQKVTRVGQTRLNLYMALDFIPVPIWRVYRASGHDSRSSNIGIWDTLRHMLSLHFP